MLFPRPGTPHEHTKLKSVLFWKKTLERHLCTSNFCRYRTQEQKYIALKRNSLLGDYVHISATLAQRWHIVG